MRPVEVGVAAGFAVSLVVAGLAAAVLTAAGLAVGRGAGVAVALAATAAEAAAVACRASSFALVASAIAFAASARVRSASLDASCAAARSVSSRARSAAAAAAAFCAWSSGFVSAMSPPLNAFIAMKPPPPTTTRPATASTAKSPALLFFGMGSPWPSRLVPLCAQVPGVPVPRVGAPATRIGIAPVGTAGRPWLSAVASSAPCPLVHIEMAFCISLAFWKRCAGSRAIALLTIAAKPDRWWGRPARAAAALRARS